MKFTSSKLKAMVAGYFRYKQQCPVIAFEASDYCKWSSGEPADVLVVTKSRMLIEIEVKISISDLRNDLKKKKHRVIVKYPDELPIEYFYFAVPEKLAESALDVVEKYFPYAGLLYVSKFPFEPTAYDFGVHIRKEPRLLSRKRLILKNILFLVKEQSGTLCRLARDKAECKDELNRRRGEVAELRKALKLADITV